MGKKQVFKSDNNPIALYELGDEVWCITWETEDYDRPYAVSGPFKVVGILLTDEAVLYKLADLLGEMDDEDYGDEEMFNSPEEAVAAFRDVVHEYKGNYVDERECDGD
jgi:hypothetical protein